MILFEKGIVLSDEVSGTLGRSKDDLEKMILLLIERELQNRYIRLMENEIRKNIPGVFKTNKNNADSN